MIYEGVNFNDEAVRKMTPAEFEARHIGVFWKDKDEETRRKMLSEVYELIAGTPTKRRRRKTDK